MTDTEVWKIQYENLIKLWSDETNRFWTRFQVFLAVNGGILAVFPIVLNLYSDSLLALTDFTKQLLLGITVVGVLESILWLLITLSGREVHTHWREMVEKLERKHKKDLDFVIVLSKEERNKPTYYSITFLSLFLPIIFIGIWLFVMILGLETDFGTNSGLENIDNP